MAVAESHSPDDELLSSSPDFAASRFTPDSSSSTKQHGVTDGIEAYELRDIVVTSSPEDLSACDGASTTDGDSEHDDKEEGRQSLVYTAEEERAVVRKFDRRLVLFVALLYMLSFLDRSSSFCPPPPSLSLLPPPNMCG